MIKNHTVLFKMICLIYHLNIPKSTRHQDTIIRLKNTRISSDKITTYNSIPRCFKEIKLVFKIKYKWIIYVLNNLQGQSFMRIINYCLLLTALFSFLIFTPVTAGEKDNQNNVPSFTNADLEKYKQQSRVKLSEEPGSALNYFDSPDNLTGDKNSDQKLKHYAVPYKAYEGTARRIIIPVTFNNRVTAPMLLDTGAPGMHISYRLAEKLGILDNKEGAVWIQMSGVGGSVPAIYTIIDRIQVGEAKDNFIPTTVSQAFSSHFEGLIGMDFMANYSVQIDTKKHVVVFEELPLNPDMPAGHDEEWWRITFYKLTSMRAAWGKYRKNLSMLDRDSAQARSMQKFADRQYREAEKLYIKLRGYASKNSVPLEWRKVKLR